MTTCPSRATICLWLQGWLERLSHRFCLSSALLALSATCFGLVRPAWLIDPCERSLEHGSGGGVPSRFGLLGSPLSSF